jgi:membrane dipeptidase
VLLYSYFDTHCDTLLKIYKEEKSIFDKNLQVNYQALSHFEKSVQCFCLYNDGSLLISDYIDASYLLKKECDKSGMYFCSTSSDIDKALSAGKVAALLCAEAIGNTPDFSDKQLYVLKKCGYSMIGFVWNYDNSLCGGCMGADTGLTDMGKKALNIMEKLSIIPDVSHMSETSFYDVCNNFCKSIVASHSNCKKICNHRRNLSDEQIIKIISSGGCVGLNFYPPFIGGQMCDYSSLENHISHILSLGGEHNICLGSDFDGIDECAIGLENSQGVEGFLKFLIGKKYPKKLVNDISFNNIYNIFKNYEILN